MRIGIEAQRLFRPHKHGMDIVALELIKALQQLDTTNDYFVFVKEDEDAYCISATENFEIVTMPAVNYMLWEQILLPFYVKKYELDLLHCTANTAPFIKSCATVLTLHDVIFMEQGRDQRTSSWYQKLGNVYRKLVVPKIIKKLDSVVTISKQEQRNILQTLPIEKEKLSVIYNGVATSFGQKTDPELLKGLYINTPYFLFLGNTEPRKNTLNVLKAFKLFILKHTGHKLVITGVKPAFIQQLLSDNDMSELFSELALPGYVSQEELCALYAGADIFLFPSLREGFGLPILEAMSFGTPVITSNISCMPEIAGNAAYLVNPETPMAIMAGMEEVSFNSQLRIDLIHRGFDRVKDFSWQKTAKDYYHLYNTITTN